MTLLELKRELTRTKQILSIAESKGVDKDVIRTFKDRVIYYQNAISEKNRNNNSSTDLKVEFSNPYRSIHSNTSKETYIESIREFGIGNIKKVIPDFFFDQPKKGMESHYERLQPNVYLYVQLKNEVKVKKLKKIAEETGREIIITLF